MRESRPPPTLRAAPSPELAETRREQQPSVRLRSATVSVTVSNQRLGVLALPLHPSDHCREDHAVLVLSYVLNICTRQSTLHPATARDHCRMSRSLEAEHAFSAMIHLVTSLGLVVLLERRRPDARTRLANGERVLPQGPRTRSRVWIPAGFLRFEFLERSRATRRRTAAARTSAAHGVDESEPRGSSRFWRPGQVGEIPGI